MTVANCECRFTSGEGGSSLPTSFPLRLLPLAMRPSPLDPNLS